MINYQWKNTDESLDSLLERRKEATQNLKDLRETANTSHQNWVEPHDEYFIAISDNTHGLEDINKKIAAALQLSLFDIDAVEQKKDECDYDTYVPHDTCA